MSQENCPANRICQCHRNSDGICLILNKSKRGGKREGAGRTAKPYKQKQMGMRVPEDIFQDCVNACNNLTKKYEKKLEKSLRNQK